MTNSKLKIRAAGTPTATVLTTAETVIIVYQTLTMVFTGDLST